jgi:uncharacterized protein YuzB (UPF0349 family)
MTKIRVEVCQTNVSKHKSTVEVLDQVKRKYAHLESRIEYLEMKCGGICGICKNTPYVLIDKKFITGLNSNMFYENVSKYLDALIEEKNTVS